MDIENEKLSKIHDEELIELLNKIQDLINKGYGTNKLKSCHTAIIAEQIRRIYNQIF